MGFKFKDWFFHKKTCSCFSSLLRYPDVPWPCWKMTEPMVFCFSALRWWLSSWCMSTRLCPKSGLKLNWRESCQMFWPHCQGVSNISWRRLLNISPLDFSIRFVIPSLPGAGIYQVRRIEFCPSLPCALWEIRREDQLCEPRSRVYYDVG